MDSIDRSMTAVRFIYLTDLEPYHVVVPIPFDSPDVIDQAREMADAQFRTATGRDEAEADDVLVQTGTVGEFIGQERT